MTMFKNSLRHVVTINIPSIKHGSQPVPLRPWEDLSLDFIVGLPPYRGHITILVVVDRFSKGVHLGMLTPNYTMYISTLLFLEIVGKLHGMPRSLESDKDLLFISRF